MIICWRVKSKERKQKTDCYLTFIHQCKLRNLLFYFYYETYYTNINNACINFKSFQNLRETSTKARTDRKTDRQTNGIHKFFSALLESVKNVQMKIWIYFLGRSFLPAILNLIQIFTGIRQWRMKTKLKILAAESYKFILNNRAGFTEVRLYLLLPNSLTWNSITSF